MELFIRILLAFEGGLRMLWKPLSVLVLVLGFVGGMDCAHRGTSIVLDVAYASYMSAIFFVLLGVAYDLFAELYLSMLSKIELNRSAGALSPKLANLFRWI